MIQVVLATPPDLLTTASPQERARVRAMLDGILPVTARAEGLRSDTAVGKHLAAVPLEAIRVPTLIVSAHDDRCGTCASAHYMATAMTGAQFIAQPVRRAARPARTCKRCAGGWPVRRRAVERLVAPDRHLAGGDQGVRAMITRRPCAPGAGQ